MIDYIILGVILIGIIVVCLRFIKRKKKGIVGCCGCSSCPGNGSCSKKKQL